MRQLNTTTRVFLALAAILAALSVAKPLRAEAGLVLGQIAPPFQGTDLKGNVYSLDGLVRGRKVTVVFFWGLRCAPCLREMAYLDSLYGEYRGEGLAVLGIEANSTGRQGILDIVEKLRSIEISPTFPLFPDPDRRLNLLFAVSEVPQTYILDADGVVVYETKSFSGEQRLEIESLVMAHLFPGTAASLTPAKPVTPGVEAGGAAAGGAAPAGIPVENEEFEKHRYFGDFYYHRQEFDKALESYGKALEIDGRNIYVLLKMGEVCVATRDFVQARQLWERVLAIDPDNGEADNNIRRLIRGDF